MKSSAIWFLLLGFGLVWPVGAFVLTNENSNPTLFSPLVDQWNYCADLALMDTELLAARNGSKIQYERVIRYSSGWYSLEETYGGNIILPPKAWLEIPKPAHFPKIVNGYTKEEVEELLKEFDK